MMSSRMTWAVCVLNRLHDFPHETLGLLQVKEKKDTLAQFETLDNGKPISEAAWDMVRFLLSAQMQ